MTGHILIAGAGGGIGARTAQVAAERGSLWLT
ncbi:NAD(P)-dependent dehydrogenase (short-subunit alcohol dehydrogenase family) [Martelella radicis]|uniref:NAD(P)-dependent dehydrogenase (Short-subunit alcohol dehydrogenase family) n=1 Tax=Martelella radicis TaxID=1397476 RepID=A0A7W6P8T6_9HYPH|nr:NAD(P)-dependent dehydrogenase (short-subunit alcohol dehydrogenase family) [Martelella radicis]